MIAALILALAAVLALHCTEEGTDALVSRVKASTHLQIAAGVIVLVAFVAAGPVAVTLAALVGFGGAKARAHLRTAA